MRLTNSRQLRLFKLLLIFMSFQAIAQFNNADIYAYQATALVDLSQWQIDFLDRCYREGQTFEANNYTLRVKTLLEFLSQEKTLILPLLENARRLEVSFCIDDRNDGSYSYYDWRFNLIGIKSYLDFKTQLIFLVHELRHVDQLAKGYCISTEYDLKEMIRLSMATEADAQAVTTLAIWHLKALGHEEVWQTLLSIEHYDDIAKAFEEEMAKGQDDLEATRLAFDTWYTGEWRPHTYYLAACSTYLDLLDISKRQQTYEALPETFFEQLCLLPDGRSYDCKIAKAIMQP